MSESKDNVKWGQLAIMVTILVITFGAVWASISNLQKDMTDVKVQLAETKKDTGYLREQWEKLTGQGQVSVLKEGNLLDKMYGKTN